MTNTTIASRLREERERLGLTQHQAAQLVGLTRRMWCRYEDAEESAEPGATTLAALQRSGADTPYILTGHRTGSVCVAPPAAVKVEPGPVKEPHLVAQNEGVRTPEQVKLQLRKCGVSISQWAIANGFSSNSVYRVLNGVDKALYGKSYEIAVALGLKKARKEGEPAPRFSSPPNDPIHLSPLVGAKNKEIIIQGLKALLHERTAASETVTQLLSAKGQQFTKKPWLRIEQIEALLKRVEHGLTLRTPAQVKEEFKRRGITVSQWAEQNGYNRLSVYGLLNGTDRGLYGKAHEIAVKLGLRHSEDAAHATDLTSFPDCKSLVDLVPHMGKINQCLVLEGLMALKRERHLAHKTLTTIANQTHNQAPSMAMFNVEEIDLLLFRLTPR